MDHLTAAGLDLDYSQLYEGFETHLMFSKLTWTEKSCNETAPQLPENLFICDRLLFEVVHHNFKQYFQLTSLPCSELYSNPTYNQYTKLSSSSWLLPFNQYPKYSNSDIALIFICRSTINVKEKPNNLTYIFVYHHIHLGVTLVNVIPLFFFFFFLFLSMLFHLITHHIHFCQSS